MSRQDRYARERHVYVEGIAINRCLWCDGPPGNNIHIPEEPTLADIEADWDASEGRP